MLLPVQKKLGVMFKHYDHVSEGQCRWISHPLTEADDRPQTKAQRATAAEAATQEPPHVHWQCFPQAAVNTVDTGFEFLWCHLREAHFHGIVKKVTFNALIWQVYVEFCSLFPATEM